MKINFLNRELLLCLAILDGYDGVDCYVSGAYVLSGISIALGLIMLYLRDEGI